MSIFFSLEGEIALSLGQANEREELNHIASEKEEALRTLESETAKLVRGCLEKDPVVHLACSLLLLSFPGDQPPWSLLCLQKSDESALRTKRLAWGPQAWALFPFPLCGATVSFSP